jgi:hypothetical protein
MKLTDLSIKNYQHLIDCPSYLTDICHTVWEQLRSDLEAQLEQQRLNFEVLWNL